MLREGNFSTIPNKKIAPCGLGQLRHYFMKDYSVLVVNDDGPASPLLPALLDALADEPWCKQVTAAVPAQEQSWIGQAITRSHPLFAGRRIVGKHSIFTISGTPADCVAIAVEHLLPNPPDIVVSGINLGSNAGLPFFLNSGTVGAARQAFLCGIKAVAFSAEVPCALFAHWHARDLEKFQSVQDQFRLLAQTSAHLARELLAGSAWNLADLFSVNLPWKLSGAVHANLTQLKKGRYPSLFRQNAEGSFVHDMSPVDYCDNVDREQQTGLPNDIDVLQTGSISVTPIWHKQKGSQEKEIWALGHRLAACSFPTHTT